MAGEGKTVATDLLGLAPYGEAINTVTKAVVDGAGAFLSRICLPVSEEFGLLLKDQVANWRTRNAAKMLATTERLVKQSPTGPDETAHPRLVHIAVEEASWVQGEQLQNMWAGLLASSCSVGSPKEDNLLLMNVLKLLTSDEVVMLNWMCGFVGKGKTAGGFVQAVPRLVARAELLSLSGIDDEDRADLIMDHLRDLGLMSITSGFNVITGEANIEVTNTALTLYARCRGHRGRIIDFYEPLESYDVIFAKQFGPAQSPNAFVDAAPPTATPLW